MKQNKEKRKKEPKTKPIPWVASQEALVLGLKLDLLASTLLLGLDR